MPDLPSGAVTFLFTDIEGSTCLWEEHPEAMRAALRHHDDLLCACIEAHGGRVSMTVGDAFCAAFADPRGGLDSVVACQQWLPALALTTPDGTVPLKVWIAPHTPGRMPDSLPGEGKHLRSREVRKVGACAGGWGEDSDYGGG